MRKKNPYCNGCGVVKTKENTSVKWTESGHEVFMDRCKLCDSIRAFNRRMENTPIEELNRLYELHLGRANKIKKVIDERLIKNYGENNVRESTETVQTGLI